MEIHVNFKAFILTCLFAICSYPSIADVLLIDVISKEPVNNPSGLLRPTTGQTMDIVKVEFGEPDMIFPTIGEPPITRWKYAKFNVYFEHNHVIHSVVNKPKKSK
jgi:hypothetical protein